VRADAAIASQPADAGAATCASRRVVLGQHLATAVTADVGDGASVADVVTALGDEAGAGPVVYLRLLELYGNDRPDRPG